MKAVILCAGRSTRTYPLTVNRTKALLRAGDRAIIEHLLDRLQGVADEAIIVENAERKVKSSLGERYGKIRLSYAIQKEALGTGNALMKAGSFIKSGNFMVMMGDNLYPRDMIKACASYGISVLGQKVGNPEDYGVLEAEGGFLKHISEKPATPKSDLANTGLYVLNDRIFGILKSIGLSRRREFELTDAVNVLAGEVRIRCFCTGEWIPVTYPWDLLKANRILLSGMKAGVKGRVERHVVMEGMVSIGRNTVIKPGTHIEGPVAIGDNCVIGPNAYIRPDTSIGNNVRFRGEAVDSVIMDRTTAKHSCYIGHSVVGEDVNIAAGTVTADYRHDGGKHVTVVRGRKVQTGLDKLGAFIGDNVRTGINTSIYPGRKIWPGLSTLPGEIVDKDRMK